MAPQPAFNSSSFYTDLKLLVTRQVFIIKRALCRHAAGESLLWKINFRAYFIVFVLFLS